MVNFPSSLPHINPNYGQAVSNSLLWEFSVSDFPSELLPQMRQGGQPTFLSAREAVDLSDDTFRAKHLLTHGQVSTKYMWTHFSKLLWTPSGISILMTFGSLCKNKHQSVGGRGSFVIGWLASEDGKQRNFKTWFLVVYNPGRI